MPHYFFHFRLSSGELQIDEIGLDLLDLDRVRAEAAAEAKALVKNAVERDVVIDGQAFEIMDEAGTLVLRYPLKKAIRTAG